MRTLSHIQRHRVAARMRGCAAALLLTAGFLLPTLFAIPSARAATPVYGYEVVAKFPHSTTSYTEGFFYLNGLFYEGTGMNGHSALLAIDPQTGQITQRHDLPVEYF